MIAEIIPIGDEILIGQVIDTNSSFIAKELNAIGVSVGQITAIQDAKIHILEALRNAESRADLIILTGGLGPTKDDVTKHTLCEYFGDALVENTEVLKHVEELFVKFLSKPISEVNKKQALVLSKSIVLHNANGTAPGMWISHKGTVFVSLPGVPFEMKGLMKDQVIPKLVKEFKRPHILHRTMVTYGMGESAIAEKISDWEDQLPSCIKLAYLPNLGKVRLRLSAKGENKDSIMTAMDKEVSKLYVLIGDIIFGEEEDGELEVIVGKLLAEKELTIATAESFTGGAIGQQLSSVPGASAYYKGSIVSYATETKIEVLKVPIEIVKEYSVVSEEVAKAMAANVRQLLKADFAIATTGNAGPAKGDSDVAVGIAYIAIASSTGVSVEKFMFGNHRERVVFKAVNKALELLRKEISKF
ncbi:MAG: competence/damage-inducible protein A [Cellulophaga sp.]